jgi:diketogulonate reductase-like aldo/keto reductase
MDGVLCGWRGLPDDKKSPIHVYIHPCDGIAYAPYFPPDGFPPRQSSTLSDVAQKLNATPKQVALAWLLHP